MSYHQSFTVADRTSTGHTWTRSDAHSADGIFGVDVVFHIHNFCRLRSGETWDVLAAHRLTLNFVAGKTRTSEGWDFY